MDRAGALPLIHTVRGYGYRLGTAGSMMALSFKARLTLWHLLAVMVILAGTGLAANWALSRVVLDRIVDDAVLALAEAEATALTTSPRAPVSVHEKPPGRPHPRSPGSTKFVQIAGPGRSGGPRER